MTRAIGRATAQKRVAAAIGVVAAVLLTATGCGDDKKSDSSGDRPLTKAELSGAALKQGDVADFKITEIDTGKGAAVKAENKSCQPIVDAMYPETSAYEKRVAARSIVQQTKDSRKPAEDYRLVVSAAESGAASEDVLTDLKQAVADCGSGFSTDASSMTSKIRSVKANKSSAGEDSVDFSLEYQIGRKVRYVVKRVGASLLNVKAEHISSHTDVAVPQEIVKAQSEKLAKAAG
ncbi:hypothetical protein [Streptomyces flavofungini]|uniref:hypothetical protein n=1 Tax=Streptomyces flavofungini TaxID=68200 RepID=UPI0034DE0DC8